MQRGNQLYKDHSPINRFKDIPKRKGGFVDALHRIEHRISGEIGAFLAALESAPVPDEERKNLIASLRQVAESLDNEGVFMNQIKTFGAKNFMPYDSDNKGRHPFKPAIFTRLNLARGDSEKKR